MEIVKENIQTIKGKSPFNIKKGEECYIPHILVEKIIRDNTKRFFELDTEARLVNNLDFCYEMIYKFELYRRILKFAYDNSAITEWISDEAYIIVYDMIDKMYCVEPVVDTAYSMSVVFNTIEAAERCIQEVVLPFIKDNRECSYV